MRTQIFQHVAVGFLYMTRVIAQGYCCGQFCPNVRDETVTQNSLSLGCELDQPEAEVERLHATQAVCCCRAPGNAPVQPDVKTIGFTREFPYLHSESECRLSPAPPPPPTSVCLSVCLSALIFSASSIHSIHGKRGQARTHTAIGVPGMSSYSSAKGAVWAN